MNKLQNSTRKTKEGEIRNTREIETTASRKKTERSEKLGGEKDVRDK